MNTNEFNEKYAEYLEPRFYGLAISDERVVEYLDQEFEKEIAINPDFLYAQIKLKFGMACVYADTFIPEKTFEWERKINEILKDEKL